MTFFGLLLRSLAYHWRAHLGAALAAAVGTAVLCGALIVGDSVKHSLLAITRERLGSAELALLGGDHFFRDDLPARLSQQPQFPKNAAAHALLLVQGIAIREADDARAYQVQIAGVNPDFWTLGSGGPMPSTPLARGEVAINASLAHKLGAKPGDAIRLRISKPGALPLDAPLGKKANGSAIVRATVKEVLPDSGLGRFSLNANQAAPYNAFLPLEDLQPKLAQKGRANVLLISGMSDTAAAQTALNAAWSLDDAQIRVRTDAPDGFAELTTPRVFLDDSFATGELEKKGAQGIATYFVNFIRAPDNGNATPYSMVTAAGAPLTDADLKDDEIELNTWAAEDLGVKPGEKIELEYFVAGLLRKLESKTAQFTLKKVVPIEGLHADRALMPDFPGIADVDSTHDWDSSIPIDQKKIRDKDDAYWKQYRGTPKAFITLAAGRRMWANRFGTYTALRMPLDNGAVSKIEATPQQFGLALSPVKALGINSAAEGTDFGGLFLGFSFFLIVAALLLMALVFQFGVESRSNEIGLLLAVGFTPRRVRLALLLEGVLVAALGSAAGVLGATVYAHALLTALATQWNAAVGTSSLNYYAEPASLEIGYASGIVMAAVAIFFAVRRQASRSARELLASNGNLEPRTAGRRGWVAPVIGWICFVAAVGLVGWALATGNRSSAEVFFSAGALLLIAGLMGVSRLFGRGRTDPPDPPFSRGGEQGLHSAGAGVPATKGVLWVLAGLGVRAATRRAGRSTATVALLACGTFLVVAVGANKQDATVNAREHSSGTGGFALYAESTGAVFEDLNTKAGRVNAGVPDALFDGVTLYPLRVKSGDEASCLNLNRAANPRVLGVPDALLQRGGFTFASALEPAPKEHPWEILKGSGDAIPAICDDQALTYILGLKLGDTMSLADEHGAVRKIKFVATLQNSILQGSVLISEENFLKLYPSLSGYSAFLIDAPFEKSAETAKGLAHALEVEGFDPIPAAERLARFNAVENTYLSTFQALGGLGMLLGSLGLGVVVLRNMLERRAELAVLRAVGYSRVAIGWLVISEHAWLLVLGLSTGLIAALVAVLPALQSTSVPVPWLSLAATLGGVFACGLLAALLATAWMVQRPLLAALRSE